MRKPFAILLAVCLALLPAFAAATQTKDTYQKLGKSEFLTLFTGKVKPEKMIQDNAEGVLAALFFLELEKNAEVKKQLPLFILDILSDNDVYTGIDRSGRAFTAFPNLMGSGYLVVALMGKTIISYGNYTESELQTFLKGAKIYRSVGYSYFIGSYQGTCEALGQDPYPYGH